MIMLRSIEKKFEKYNIDYEPYVDENRLSKSFALRSFQFIGSDSNERRKQLDNDL